jgi:glycosyltransferase involved in cell wall biosynthesis
VIAVEQPRPAVPVSAVGAERHGRRGRLDADFDLTLVADGDCATLRIIELLLRGAEGIGRVDLVMGAQADAVMRASRSKLLLVRTGDIALRNRVARLVASETPYVYYLDDNFWLLLGDSPVDHFYQHPLVREAIELCISGARLVICHSERFRQMLLRMNPNVTVIPPHFDFDLLGPVQGDSAGSEVRIGVVGNISRAIDIAFLVEVVRNVLSNTPANVVFEFFGYTPPELEGVDRVRSLQAIRNYDAFIRAQQQRGWRLALAPLMDTPFAAYKTNNKFREFGACGIAAIYSDTSVYRDSVEHGVTGWVLPNDAGLWTAQLLEALADMEATSAIGQAACRAVREHHEATQVRRLWLEALRSAYRETWAGRLRRALAGQYVRLLENVPARGNLMLTPKGPSARLPGKRNGYARPRPILFELRRGDVLETTFTPLLVGPFGFAMVIATSNSCKRAA